MRRFMICTPLHLLFVYERRMRWAGYVVCKDKKRNACRIVVAKSEGKRQLRGSMCRWEDNIKIDLKERR
jgi:hypothetical protein